VAPQGLRGELRVLPSSDFPERFTEAGPRWLRAPGQEPRPVTLLRGRPLPGRGLFVVRLEEAADRTAAEALVGQELLVPASDRPRLAEGEFHALDLVGLEARLLPEGRAIGTVSDLLGSGQSLLAIRLAADPGRTVLVPFVAAIVPEVHPRRGWLGLTPPPGLLDL
jgi:16S rRNA processing protein RimM